jgi:glycosyltransferase involved in cell wall biosynthesis
MTRTWTEAGHEVTVLAGMFNPTESVKYPEYKGKYYKHKQQGKVKVLRCHVSESYNKSFLGRFWGYLSFMFSALWGGLFKLKGKYDLILVTSPPLFVGVTAYLLSRFKRIPFVFEIRDLWPESAIDTGVVTNKWVIKMAYAFEAFIYKKASLINVLTPAFRDKLIQDKKVPAQKIIFIPNAADFSILEKLPADFDAVAFKKSLGLEGKFVITYVGAHGVANHLIQLLDAAELLRDSQVIFQLIGSGMQKEMLQTEAAKRNLNNVIFRPPVAKEEVFKYILASDMGASVLKKVDTFKTIYSNKTFDYMSCKMPILLLIDGVSRQLVEEAGCGIYAEPENAKDIAEKVRHCLSIQNQLPEMGEKGYAYARAHFDREVLAKQYAASLEKLLMI